MLKVPSTRSVQHGTDRPTRADGLSGRVVDGPIQLNLGGRALGGHLHTLRLRGLPRQGNRAHVGGVCIRSGAGVRKAPVGVGMGQWVKYRALDVLAPTRVVLYGNLVPVATLVLAWIAIGTPPSLLEIVAAGCIVAGAVCLQVLDLTVSASAPQPDLNAS